MSDLLLRSVTCLSACRLQRSDDTIKRKDDEQLDQREQLTRLRDDFDELRGQYAALTAQGHGKEQQRELSVSGQGVLCAPLHQPHQEQPT